MWKKYRHKSISIYVSVLALVAIFFYSDAYGKITGSCANCHTMHNSQNGSPVAVDGQGAGWDSSAKLAGGSIQTEPSKTLLISGCVGCHSSTTDQTIVTIGGSRVPIVFNTGGYPTQPLAGGNFYFVSLGGTENDVYGHNVYGVADMDGLLSEAPGRQSGTCGGATSCHKTLAEAKDTGMTQRNSGCEGCHTQVAHHDESKPWCCFSN
ncbi:MAG: hypothetical protein AB1442_10875 [Nitrospirota bacterium]